MKNKKYLQVDLEYSEKHHNGSFKIVEKKIESPLILITVLIVY